MYKSMKPYKLLTDNTKDNKLFTISLPKERTAVTNVPNGDNPNVENGPVDFERAITLTGYGTFNYWLLLAILPAACSSISGATAISFVLPAAKCDLKLTSVEMGLLNSVTFAGMICSAVLWGFVSDTFGRKTLLVYGYFVDAVVCLAGSLSQVFWILILSKFMNGFISNGPYAALMSYLAEIHGDKHRSRTYMWLGVFYSLGNISVPCLAWLIIPQDWRVTFFDDYIVINSWRIFLAVCTIPEFIACFAMSFFPESPRFLMSKGRTQEALEVFKKIYHMNTGNDPDSYPVKSLVEEKSIESSGKSITHLLRSGCRQLKPLFLSPYIYRVILITLIQFGSTLGSSSLRLWMPQLFALIETYEKMYPVTKSSDRRSMCDIINATKHQKINSTSNEEICTDMVLDAPVYIKSIVISLTGAIGYTMAGVLINAMGKQKLMVTCFLAAGTCCGGLYWAQDVSGILGLSSVFVALSSIGGGTVVNVIVDNFPTYLRTTAVSITLLLGRVGAIVGNLLFPILLDAGCLGPFIMIGTACLACAFLAIILPSGKISTSKETELT